MRLCRTQMSLEIASLNGRPEPIAGEIAGSAAAVRQVLQLMPAEDRRLAELVLILGSTQRDAAVELGIDAATVGRRLRRLRAMLACPTRRAVAAHLHTLAPEHRERAVQYFFLGYSIRLMAQHRHVARSVVQREIDFLRGWVRALQRAERTADRAARAER